MKETGKRFHRHLRKNEGFVSYYFLAMLLYIVSLMSVILLKDVDTMYTEIQMIEAGNYQKMEIEVLYDLKERVKNDEFDLSMIALKNCSYSVEKNDNLLYVEIKGEREETMIVTFDPESKILLDYVCERNVEQFP